MHAHTRMVQAVVEQRRVEIDKCTEKVRRIRSDLKNEKRKHAHEVRSHPRPGPRHHEASKGSCKGEGCFQLAKCFANR